MNSLDRNFNDLRNRLELGRSLNSYGTDPVFYLVFAPSDLLAVKRQEISWRGQLTNSGWDVSVFSLGKMIQDFFNLSPGYQALREFEPEMRKDYTTTELLNHQSVVSDNLRALVMKDGRLNPELMAPLLKAVEDTNNRTRGLLLLTDAEALHPVLRINTIENYLLGKIRNPVVVLYPGTRHGQTALSFLGIYPPDPNYRSEHIG
jgi:hypothetical protein